jgi:hypothetical protein
MSLLDTASLIVTPNAYKEGKLYSVIPSDGSGDFTFTRATTATRVNSDGLVELVPYNLFQYSEEFDNASWAKTASSVTANSTNSPSGIVDADTFTADGTSAQHQIRQLGTVTSGLTYTTSIYAKKNTNNFIQIYNTNTFFGSNVWANFDLNLGVVGSVGTATTASIQNVGNGWYRCTITGTATASGSVSISFFNLITSATSARGENNTLSTSVFLWGAQFVEGTNALPYQKTETRLNIPRLDYSLGGCPNILLEPQRTNLALYSSSFDNAVWNKGTGGSISSNSVISPDGTQNADAYTWATSTSSFAYLSQQTIGISQNPNTFSVWLKRPSGSGNRTIRLVISDVLISNAASSTFTVTETWQRFEFTSTSAATTGYIGVGFFQGSTGTSIASGEILEVWGAQIELGSYSTSFIPTTTASVTRNQDQCVKTGISSLINSTEGVLYAEINALKYPVDVNNWLTITDGTNANSVGIQFETNGKATGRIEVGGVGQASITTSVDYSNFIKVAFKYKENDFAWWVNGVEVGTDLSGITFPSNTLNSLQFAYGAGGNNWKGNVQNVMVFPTVLSDDELATLTTI